MSDEDNQPISWIQQMLQIGPKDRISSVHLLDDILGHADHHIYYGHCCADQDEEASSCKSSEFEDSDTGGLGVEESTNATSVLSERSGEDKTLVGVAEIAPDKSTPSLIQDFVDGNPDSLTNKSGQSASPFESILRSRTPVPRQPDDTPAQDLAQYESIQRTVSQPEVPMWQSKNPFRPNYTPSHTSESAPPHGSVFQSPIQTQVNPFLPSPQEEAAPITGRDEVYDTAVKSPLSDNDATRPDALTDEASTAPENAPSTSAHHNLSIGSNPSLDTLNLLFDSAVNGDVSGISTYLSGGNELHEGAFAKSVFHAAAVNEQWAVMQLLIDAGCSVFPDDVTSYILPAIGNRQIEIDDLKITHRPILEQLKAVRTRKKHEALMLEDSLRKSEGESSGQDQSGASNEKENAKSGQVGFYTDFCEDVAKEKSGTFGTIEVPKSNFPSSYGMALGPWDPAGMHWDLTVTPDPELLHKVIRKGDYARVLSIINSGYSLNMRDEDGLSPLDVAIELGLTSLIRTLDVYGANPRLRDTHGLDAYDKAKARFFGEELRQVLNIFDQHKDTMSTTRPNDIQFPRYNNTTWNVFLEPYKEVPEKVARKKANESDQFEYAWPESWQIAVPTRYRWLFDAFGQLIWYEWPQDILDAYPGELFELEDTSMDTSTKTQWLIPKNPSNKPKWLRKLFSDTT
jgi:ankyrin repeat protein